MSQKIATAIKSNKDRIAVALILLSLIMLFMPWISVYVTVSGMRISLEDVSDLASYSSQEIRKVVAELEADAQNQGYDFDGSSMISISNCIRDSAFSPFELIRFMSSCQKLIKQLEKVLGSWDSSILLFKTATSDFAALEICLSICLLAEVVAGVYLLLKRARSNRKVLWLYCGCSIVIFAFFAILTVALNSRSRDANSLLNNIFSSYSNRKTSLTPFHMTFWSFLFLLSAAGAGIMGIFFGENTNESVATVSFLNVFLSLFKRRRKICPYCGKAVKGDASFCIYCGKELGNELEEFIDCLNCGTRVKKGTAVCPKCGKDPYKKPEPPKPPEPFIDCVNCGAKVKKGSAVCPNCGKNPSFINNFFKEPIDL